MHLSAKTSIMLVTLALSTALLTPSHFSERASNPPERWQLPLGTPLRVIAPFDLPNGPYQAGHRGIDLRASGSPQVVSPVHGVVAFVGTVVDRPVISIRVDNRTTVSLEPLTSELVVGDPVTRGQTLGTVSTGGHCAFKCLHIGVRIDGDYVNPLRFFVPRAVLVPW